MRRLLLPLLFAAGVALAQAPSTGQKIRDAQQAIGAGDCSRAQTILREVIGAEPQNYAAHLLSAHCSLRQSDYKAAIEEFSRSLELRPDAPPALLGLIQAYALSGDPVHRDAAIERLRALITAHKIPATVRFVREQFTAGHSNITASEYPIVSLSRSRYLFEVFDSQQKAVEELELVSRDEDQSGGTPRRFTLLAKQPSEPGTKTVRVYDRGEPAYEQVVRDVKAVLSGHTLQAGSYALASNPAAIEPMPITVDDPSDPRLRLEPGQVAIESIAHSCFRIHTASGARILIDPYASRMWLGYDFPAKLAADAVLITHPHYDHDADVLIGQSPPPWAADVRVLRDPGSYRISGAAVIGVRGKHGGPWGKEFGQTNTIWLLDLDGLRIAHLGDNGPLTVENLQALGRVDILMMPIDAKHHILTDEEIQATRKALHPRIVIPMHYRIPELERSPDSPEGLGEIGPWLAGQENVVRLERSIARFTAGTLLPSQVIVVFPHSPKVSRP